MHDFEGYALKIDLSFISKGKRFQDVSGAAPQIPFFSPHSFLYQRSLALSTSCSATFGQL